MAYRPFSRGLLLAASSADAGRLEVTLWDIAAGGIHSTLIFPSPHPSSAAPSVSQFETPGLGRSDDGERVAIAFSDAPARVAVVHVARAAVEWSLELPLASAKVRQMVMLDAESLMVLTECGRAYLAQRSPIPRRASKRQDLLTEEPSDDDDMPGAAASSKPGEATVTGAPNETTVDVTVKQWLKHVPSIVALYAASPDVITIVTSGGKLVTASTVGAELLFTTEMDAPSLSVLQLRSAVCVAASGEPLLRDSGFCKNLLVSSEFGCVLVDSTTGSSRTLVDCGKLAKAESRKSIRVRGVEYQTPYSAAVITESMPERQEIRYFALTGSNDADLSAAATNSLSGTPKSKMKGGSATSAATAVLFEALPPVVLESGQLVITAGFNVAAEQHIFVLHVDGSFVMAGVSNDSGAPSQEMVDGAAWSLLRPHVIAPRSSGSKAVMRYTYPFAAPPGSDPSVITYDVVSRPEVHTRCAKTSCAPILLAGLLRESLDAKTVSVGSSALTAWNPVQLRRAVRLLQGREVSQLFDQIVEAITTAAHSPSHSYLAAATAGAETAVQLVTLQHQFGLTFSDERVRQLYTSIAAVRELGTRWSHVGARSDAIVRHQGAKAVEQAQRDDGDEAGDSLAASPSSGPAVAGRNVLPRNRLIRRENTAFKRKYAVGGGSLSHAVNSLMDELPQQLRDSTAILGTATAAGRATATSGYLAAFPSAKGESQEAGTWFQSYESHFLLS